MNCKQYWNTLTASANKPEKWDSETKELKYIMEMELMTNDHDHMNLLFSFI